MITNENKKLNIIAIVVSVVIVIGIVIAAIILTKHLEMITITIQLKQQ